MSYSSLQVLADLGYTVRDRGVGVPERTGQNGRLLVGEGSLVLTLYLCERSDERAAVSELGGHGVGFVLGLSPEEQQQERRGLHDGVQYQQSGPDRQDGRPDQHECERVHSPA